MVRLILFMAACGSCGLWLFCVIMELSAIKQIRTAAMEAGNRNFKLNYNGLRMMLFWLAVSVILSFLLYPW